MVLRRKKEPNFFKGHKGHSRMEQSCWEEHTEQRSKEEMKEGNSQDGARDVDEPIREERCNAKEK